MKTRFPITGRPTDSAQPTVVKSLFENPGMEFRIYAVGVFGAKPDRINAELQTSNATVHVTFPTGSKNKFVAALNLREIILCLALSLSVNLRAADAPTPPSTDFRVTTAFPKYVTAEIEFRDPTGVKWPNFFYGKPANDTGVINLESAKPTANFSLLCDKMAQEKGDQSRKVLGELCPPDQPPAVRLIITTMGNIQPAPPGKDKTGFTADLAGTLEIAGRKVPVKAQANFRHHQGKGDEKNIALMLDGRFTVKAADLGLKTLAADALVAIRFALTAYPPQPAIKPK